MKISKVTVENFRSICHAEVQASAFNVFVGQNNHGKTNFFAAIEWFYTGSGDVGMLRNSSAGRMPKFPLNWSSLEFKPGSLISQTLKTRPSSEISWVKTTL